MEVVVGWGRRDEQASVGCGRMNERELKNFHVGRRRVW